MFKGLLMIVLVISDTYWTTLVGVAAFLSAVGTAVIMLVLFLSLRQAIFTWFSDSHRWPCIPIPIGPRGKYKLVNFLALEVIRNSIANLKLD